VSLTVFDFALLEKSCALIDWFDVVIGVDGYLR
jgi:hypothetical protein